MSKASRAAIETINLSRKNFVFSYFIAQQYLFTTLTSLHSVSIENCEIYRKEVMFRHSILRKGPTRRHSYEQGKRANLNSNTNPTGKAKVENGNDSRSSSFLFLFLTTLISFSYTFNKCSVRDSEIMYNSKHTYSSS